MVDSEIFDLTTRLRQIQEETELLAAQQHELQRQLRTLEKTARGDLHEKILDGGSDVRAEEWRLEQEPDHDMFPPPTSSQRLSQIGAS
ncbi:MAG: hypothetical protein HY290_00840 [Planctomycetia bacterium]|nr:hypothetical protein [Planctomycetia bacterium]